MCALWKEEWDYDVWKSYYDIRPKWPFLTQMEWFKVKEPSSISLIVPTLIQSHPNFTYLPKRVGEREGERDRTRGGVPSTSPAACFTGAGQTIRRGKAYLTSNLNSISLCRIQAITDPLHPKGALRGGSDEMKDSAGMEVGEKRLWAQQGYFSCSSTDTAQGEPTEKKGTSPQNTNARETRTPWRDSFLVFPFWFPSLREEAFRQRRRVATFIRPPTHLSSRRFWINHFPIITWTERTAAASGIGHRDYVVMRLTGPIKNKWRSCFVIFYRICKWDTALYWVGESSFQLTRQISLCWVELQNSPQWVHIAVYY